MAHTRHSSRTITELYEPQLALPASLLPAPSPSDAGVPSLDGLIHSSMSEREQLRAMQAKLVELRVEMEELEWEQGVETAERLADSQQRNQEKLVRVLRERERAAAPLTVVRSLRPLLELGQRKLSHQQSALRCVAEISRHLHWLGNLRQRDPNTVEAILSVNVVFAVDCTASMHQWRTLLVQCLPDMVKGVKQAVPISNLRLGFAGYRDCFDQPRYLLQPMLLSTSLPLLQDWIGQLPLEGGGDDCPEDVLGGLQMANQLLADHRTHLGDLAARTSCLILMGDSPAHGPDMHTAAVPDSEDNLRLLTAADGSSSSARSILQQLSSDGTELAVVRLNSAVDDMLTTFRSSFDDSQRPHHMVVLDASLSPEQPRSWEERRAELGSKLASFVTGCLRKTILRLNVDDTPGPPSPN